MKYTALFRGINVGGKHIIKMVDLRRFLSKLGMYNVTTYIQSGNAVFETLLEEAPLSRIIRDEFRKNFGFESGVKVRSENDLKILIESLPFSEGELAQMAVSNPRVEHLYVYFLENPPEKNLLDSVHDIIEGDKLGFGHRELYILCQKSIRNSKLAAYLAKRFKFTTVRNWKTVKKLYDMMKKI
ncbi:MAG: hypothetical protein PWQ77_2115 [Kosmotogales bacterium]|nr:hypothetical protein [Kosmotogales bacterium]